MKKDRERVTAELSSIIMRTSLKLGSPSGIVLLGKKTKLQASISLRCSLFYTACEASRFSSTVCTCRF